MKYELVLVKWITLGLMALTVQFELNAQIQKGDDIYGEEMFERTPSDISMPDGNTIAVGSAQYGGEVQDIGRVRIFEFDGSDWIQKGQDILGEASNDYFGASVCMPDVNTVGVGAVYNDAAGTNAGHARIFIWDGEEWVQKGTDLDGEAEQDYFGFALSMPDANTVAIGGYLNDGGAPSSGHVRIYDWNGTTWVQRGGDIDGEEATDYLGWSVSMPDANTVGIGAPFNSTNGSGSGKVQVYEWTGTEWSQLGNSLFGDAEDDKFGSSIAMPDVNTIAVGAFGFDNGQDNSANFGLARVFSWDGTSWSQKGLDIVGEEEADRAGGKVYMPDDNTLAVGATGHSGEFIDEGQVRVFSWTGSEWTVIADIIGENDADLSGSRIAMGDANTVAIGAETNDEEAPDAGHVRVYDLSSLGVIDNSFETDINIFPNPTIGPLDIDLGKIYENISVSIQDVQGKNVLEINRASGKVISLNIQDLNPGIYLLTVQEKKGKKALMRVLKY